MPKPYENRQTELTHFLPEEFVAALSTSNGQEPAVCSIFFVHEAGRIFYKSRTESCHSINLSVNDAAAVSVWASGSNYDAKYGAQLRGVARRVREPRDMARVVAMYENRFPGSGAKLPSIDELCSDSIKSTFYEFEIRSFRIVDETKEHNRTISGFVEFDRSIQS